MKQILTIITLALIMGCEKEPIEEPEDDLCVYDCVLMEVNEQTGVHVLQCKYIYGLRQIYDYEYDNLKCE